MAGLLLPYLFPKISPSYHYPIFLWITIFLFKNQKNFFKRKSTKKKIYDDYLLCIFVYLLLNILIYIYYIYISIRCIFYIFLSFTSSYLLNYSVRTVFKQCPNSVKTVFKQCSNSDKTMLRHCSNSVKTVLRQCNFLIISLSLILALLQALCPDIISNFELFGCFCVTITFGYEKYLPFFWLVL